MREKSSWEQEARKITWVDGKNSEEKYVTYSFLVEDAGASEPLVDAATSAMAFG